VNPDYRMLAAIAVAILGGAAVGVERQRSGHASGTHARLGGIRTFTLIGTVGGIAGLLTAEGFALTAAVLEAGALALVVVGYFRASGKDIDATTEVAALAVLGSGTLAGLGHLSTSAALTTITVLLLAEKTRLHRMVARIDEETLRAAARFAVMSVVILPLLPAGPYGPAPGIRPRELWVLVLLFSGLSFAGVIAQRMVGAAGYPLTGLLGGLVSSTSVTLAFARLSRKHAALTAPLAIGVMAASTILFIRVLAVVAVLDATMVPRLAWYLAAPFLVGVAGLAVAWRSWDGAPVPASEPKNPLRFRSAIEMAALFQAVLFAVYFLKSWLGDPGLLAGGFVLGLTDVDALTLSMTRSIATGTSIDIACRAILVGVIANSLMKAGIAVTLGQRRFAWQAAVPLITMAAAGAAMVVIGQFYALP
jgi:uncharacterized membrane protein (DUF4010 family)